MSAKKSAGPIVGAVLVILVAVGAAFWGITTRARALAVVTRETRELAVPTVAVAVHDLSRRLADRVTGVIARTQPVAFSWIHGRRG